MATRLLILIAALGLAATQQSSQEIETEYKEGKEYIYDYESQILSGLPVGAKLFSGFKLVTRVHFQFFSSSQVKMMLTNPRLFEINEDITKGDPTREMIPTEQYKEMTGPESDRIKTKLLEPVKFKYVRGHVEDVIVESDDPEWSVNMKKGCLSLLEMNFNDRNSLSRDVKLQSHRSQTPTVLLYTVMEPSVTGECETTYQFYWDRQLQPHNMEINKVRNFDRCLEKAIHTADMTNGRPCDFCDKMKTTETMSAQSSVKYSLMGSPYQYIITSAVAESQYNFVPYTETRGRMTTFANQTLSLVHSKPISAQIPEPVSPLVQKLALQARHPDQKSNSPMSSWRSDLEQSELEEILKMAIEVMKRIDAMSVDKTREEMSAMVLELKRLVRKMDKTILNKFIHIIVQSNSWPRASKTLYDLLPMIGTFEVVDVLIKLIEDVPKFSSTPAFMSLALMPQPDVFMVKRVMSYLDRQENIMSDDRLLKRASWLCLGALGHKMIKTNKVQVEELERQHQIVSELLEQSNDLEVRKRLDQRLTQLVNMLRDIKDIYSTTRQQIVQMINRLYKESNKDSQRLALKVIGALGYEEFFPLILTSIRAEHTPLLWKMEAIISLQKLAKTIPVQIRRQLLPLFFDRGQPEEIRSVSFLVFVLCEPERAELEMIAGTMRDEPSVNIASLIWTTLRELSNKTTTCPSIKSVVQNATLALRFAEKSQEGLQYSSFKFQSAFDKNVQMGNAYEQVVLYSIRQRAPVSYSMQYMAAFFGKSSDVFQFGYKGIGLDEIFNKLYGNLEETKDTGILDLFSSYWKPSGGKSWEQNIKDIKDKLGVKPRPLVHPEGDVYMKVFGQELIYLDLPSIFNIPSADSSEQPSLGRLLPDITNIHKSIKQLLKTQRTMLYPLWYSTFTSETGLPLNVHVNMLNIFRLDGDLMLPEGSKSDVQKSRLDRPQPWLKLHNSGLHELQGTMEVDMKYITSTVSLKGRLYTDVPLSLDLRAEKSKFLVKVKNMKKMVPMKLDTFVRTIIQKFPVKVTRYPIRPDIKEVDFVDGVDMKLFRYVHGVDMFGRNLTLEGQRAVRRDDEMPLPPFSGKQVMHVIYDPMQTKEIDIQFLQIQEHTPERRQDRTSSRPGPQDNVQYNRRDNKRFVNLDDKDVTMEYLKDKFSSDRKIVPLPWKHGMVMQFSDPGPNAAHWLQLATMYQCSKDKLTQKYGLELLRAPKPSETKPWGILADTTLKFPTKVVEPSDLQTRDYQQQLRKRIKQLFDGKQADTLLDLSTLSVTNSWQKYEELRKIGDSNSIVENLLNHILELSSQQSTSIKHIVQEQRQLNKDTDDLLRQPVDSKQAEKSLLKVKQVLMKSKSLLEKLLVNVDSIVRDNNPGPEVPVMVQYVVYLNTKMETDLVKIAQKLKSLLSSDENYVIEQSLKEQTQKINIVRQRQERLVNRKRSIEEESPEDIEIIKDVRDMKRKLVTLLGKMDGRLYNEQTSDLVDELLANTKSIKEKLDKVIMDKVNIDRTVRVEFVEVILLEKQAVLDMKQKLDLELQQKYTVATYTHGDKYVEDQKMKKLSQQKEELKKEASNLANRMVLLINNEKENMSLKPTISPMDQQRLRNLQKIRFMQLQVMEILETKSQATSDQRKELSSVESVRLTVSSLKEISQKIEDIINDIINDKLEGKSDEKIVLCPVLIRSLNIMSVQLEIIEKVQQDIREKISDKSAQEDFNLQEYERLEEEVKHLRGKLIQEIPKVEKLVKKDIISAGSETYKQKPQTLLQLQKTIIMMQSKKLELRTLMEKLLQIMSGSASSRQESYRKQLIYSFIHQGQDLQTSLSDVYQRILDPEQPETLVWQDVDQELWEIQQELVTMVQKVENTVQDKARSFMTYVQDLQNLQQFKDQVLREQHKLGSQRSSTKFVPAHQKQMLYDMYGVTKIMFGTDGGEVKHILIKVFGSKSLEQLLWEQDQWSPLKQDPLVREYLSDKRGQDDSVAHRYQQIKDELNTYKHLHAFCTYERTVPSGLREVFWKIREYLKYRFYNQATLLMPDSNNSNNTVEVTTEIKRNNRWMDMEIKCPQESVHFRNVRIPEYCQYYITPQTENIQDHFIRTVSGSKLPATCLISHDRLKTLDGQIYPLSLSPQSCETVLAMDCSAENRFVVTRRSETSNPRKHVIKVVSQRHHVELTPSQSQISVKMNGELVDLTDSPVQSNSSGEILILRKHEDGTIEVKVPQLSLAVVYKQEQVTVKLGGLYWSRVCGICGNMDGVKSNDLEGPHQVIYPQPAPFLSTYLLSGQTCDPQQIQEQHRIKEIRNKPRYVQPIPMTKISKIQYDGLTKTCFSKTPVTKCPPSSNPDGFLSQSIEYTCLRQTSPVTRRLVEKVQRDGVLDEVPTAPGPTLSVNQPRACVVVQ